MGRSKVDKVSTRIQNVVTGAAAELYELAISKSNLVSIGVLRLAQDKSTARVFFGNEDEVEAILRKYNIKQYDSSTAKQLSVQESDAASAQREDRTVSVVAANTGDQSVSPEYQDATQAGATTTSDTGNRKVSKVEMFN